MLLFASQEPTSSGLLSIRIICRASGSWSSRCRGTGWDTPVAGFRYQSCLVPCLTNSHPNPRSLGSNLFASWDCQLPNLASTCDLTSSQVEVQVAEVIEQVVPGLSLGLIVGVLLQIAEPGIAFLPVNVFDRLHRRILYHSYSNDCTRLRRLAANALTSRSSPPARPTGGCREKTPYFQTKGLNASIRLKQRFLVQVRL